jgi:fumarate hydratase subunit beta
MIGKGDRSPEVKKAIKKYKGIYFVTYAGCAAFLAGRVSAARAIAYRDLGPEAVMELEVKDFPLIVAVDSRGRSIYGQD